MKIELIFEDRIFTYDERYFPKGYTSEEFQKERPDCLTVNLNNHLPNIDDIFIWGDIEKPQKATDKQWEIIKEYSFKVERRQIGMDGYVGLNLLIA